MNNNTPQNTNTNNSQNNQKDPSRTLFTSSLANQQQHKIPEINLPKGGGAIKGIDEKFEVNPVNGTNSVSIPLPVAPARNGFSPSLAISYNSGGGNGLFGMGWGLGLPSIQRKTDKQLPRYIDGMESDTFIMAGAEDLIPLLEETSPDVWEKVVRTTTTYKIKEYRPRIEGSWIRIEQWMELTTGIIHWRTISTNNVVTVYGINGNSRIANPEAPNTDIFEWLISYSYDNMGNIILYEYKEEDLVGVPNYFYEKNRSMSNVTNRYLKRVHYGNKTHFTYTHGVDLPDPSNGEFLFETVFDYGEHAEIPTPAEVDNWTARQDAFSSFRSGFDIRTYRLCERVLLFHKFDLADQPVADYLVAAVKFVYEGFPDVLDATPNLEGFTYLKQVVKTGYLYDTNDLIYKSKPQPPLCFYYQKHEWNTTIKTLSDEALKHAPTGINNSGYTWTDLYSEGLSGILTEQSQAWYYKQNLGGGNFSGARLLAEKPSFAGLNGGGLQLQDLEGSGEKQLVNWAGDPKGFFQFEDGEEWKKFQLFESIPNINMLNDPNARFIDLDGDGRPDLLITNDNLFQWYESKGKKGFGKMNQVRMPWNEEEGPRIIFADQEQRIFLADMTGSGMTDIVRIKNGSICYWANKGYGKFSAKITMENAPQFDHSDLFHPQYIQLVDIDGSGTTDICYLGKSSIQIWMNHNGNSWSIAPKIISPFPTIDNQTNIDFVDLLGNGTSCIVWSSAAAKDQRVPLRYIDLCDSKKPHLLYQYKNNMGKEVRFEYLPSTHFYLQDKNAGQPWATKLPFPVHLVHKTQSKDWVRNTVFVSKYSYHHGFYDSIEREFRGFGRVEQLDTEDFDLLDTHAGNIHEDHFQMPIKSISWFHTGASFKHQKLTDVYQNEYYQNPTVEQALGGITLPSGLSDQAYHEAFRACKGLLLRQEVYSLDTDNALHIHPYSAAESAYKVQLVQPHEGQKYASFIVIPVQSLTYAYERNPADPRISHNLVLHTDDLGIPTETASVIYPRFAIPASLPWMVRAEQAKLHVVYNKISLTEDVNTYDDGVSTYNSYRLRTSWEEQIFEILGLSGNTFFSNKGLDDIIKDSALTTDIPFDQDYDQSVGGVQKRLSGHAKVQFLANDLLSDLPFGEQESLGIPYKTYQMVYSPGLVGKLYLTALGTDLLTTLNGVNSGFFSDLNGNIWSPSGRTTFPNNATTNFYIPDGVEDFLGNVSWVYWDDYKLLPTKSIDALGNEIIVENDYRVLSPKLITDPNLNRTAVEFDELGIVVKSAVMGKDGMNEGDTLEHPTAEMSYDYFSWMNDETPNWVYSKVREVHYSVNPTSTAFQESYVYSDGSGQAVVTKVKTKEGDVNTPTGVVFSNPRWIGSGRTILDNKGNPIKQYEPYFSDTFEYDTEEAAAEIGVTSILYYDAAGRNVRTVLPNKTFVKVVFDAWQTKTYDTNDTVLESKWYLDLLVNNAAILNGLNEPTDPELRAAWLAKQHANTPSVAHTDCLGRTIYAEQRDEKITDPALYTISAVYTQTDLAGRFSKIYDQIAVDQLVASVDYTIARGVSAHALTNMVGQAIYNYSAAKGENWVFIDALGRIMQIWDNPDAANIQNRIIFRTLYDVLHRPTETFVTQGAATEICFAKTIYGEGQTDDQLNNLRGQVYQSFDQSGILTTEQLDFKGNPLSITRQLVEDYINYIDWTGYPATSPTMESDTFTTSAAYDALNRPTQTTLPDNSIVVPTYNAGGYLEHLEVTIRGQGSPVVFMDGQDFDAKGQRQFVKYGNETITRFLYDANTFRLSNLLTMSSDDTTSLQDLDYTYDPVGNITEVRDNAQQTYYYSNQIVIAEKKYSYDAQYRLKSATGREHISLGVLGSDIPSHQDLTHLPGMPPASHLGAVCRYTQTYQYDKADNILMMKHVRDTGGGWTRGYKYNSITDASNKLLSTKVNGWTSNYHYDYSGNALDNTHGNMTKMPHLQALNWNFQDQLQSVELLGGVGTAYYNYDASGQRVRKVVVKSNSREERLYLGGVERYREYSTSTGTTVSLERWTLQVEGIAQVDTLTMDSGSAVTSPVPAIRYQYKDHLGSATLETNELGDVISYEEYHPFGSSAYRVEQSGTNLSLKRYRFTNKERDDETGLYYFGVRYYAAWLGRWSSSDPGGFVDGLNVYQYGRNNPVKLVDEEGYSSVEPVDLVNRGEHSDAKPENAVVKGDADTGVELVNLENIDKGDNDYFDQYGNFIKSDDNGDGVFIYADGLHMLPTLITDYKAVKDNQKQALANVFNYYYDQVSPPLALPTKDLSNNSVNVVKHKPGDGQIMDSSIYKAKTANDVGLFSLNVYLFNDDEVHALNSTSANIKSNLGHEHFHKKLSFFWGGTISRGGQYIYKAKDFGPGKYDESHLSRINHIDVYMAEISADIYKDTTAEFKYMTIKRIEAAISSLGDPILTPELIKNKEEAFKNSTGQTINEFYRQNQNVANNYYAIQNASPKVKFKPKGK